MLIIFYHHIDKSLLDLTLSSSDISKYSKHKLWSL